MRTVLDIAQRRLIEARSRHRDTIEEIRQFQDAAKACQAGVKLDLGLEDMIARADTMIRARVKDEYVSLITQTQRLTDFRREHVQSLRARANEGVKHLIEEAEQSQESIRKLQAAERGARDEIANLDRPSRIYMSMSFNHVDPMSRIAGRAIQELLMVFGVALLLAPVSMLISFFKAFYPKNGYLPLLWATIKSPSAWLWLPTIVGVPLTIVVIAKLFKSWGRLRDFLAEQRTSNLHCYWRLKEKILQHEQSIKHHADHCATCQSERAEVEKFAKLSEEWLNRLAPSK